MRLHPIELENIFERLQIPQNLEFWKIHDNESFRQLKALELIDSGDYNSSLRILDQLFKDSLDTLTQLFCIQWAVALSETLFDLQLRKYWMEKWKDCTRWSSDPWGRYLNRFQTAVQYYYEQSLIDSEKLFVANLIESEKTSYIRGSVRSLFHLGLIYKTWGQWDKARDTFSKAKKLTLAHSLLQSQKRIDQQLELLTYELQSIEKNLAEVEKLLISKNFRAARKQVLFCCRIRRQEKRSWMSLSENAYLALVSYAFKKNNRFHLILKTINDRLVLEQIFRIADKIRPLEYEEREFAQYLKSLSGYDQISSSIDKTQVTVGAATITQSDDREVQLLMTELIEREMGSDKEALTQLLWNSVYDPIYHDPKIYRVIHRARKRIGNHDLIVNKYGFYILGTHLKN